MSRTFLVAVGLVPLTVVLGGWLIVFSWFGRPSQASWCSRVGALWARGILRLGGVRVRIEGLERVDWSRPMVVVANHQSWFDVFALVAHLPANYRFVGKEELARIPVFGRAWTGCGHVTIDRDDRGRAIDSLDRAGERVQREGLALVLFPEGTRSPDGRLRPFKKGAFVLALKFGIPVVPVGISGSREVMPKGSFRIRSGRIRIRVGEPIAVEGLDHTHRNRLCRRAEEAVAALRDPSGTGEGRPADPGRGRRDERSGAELDEAGSPSREEERGRSYGAS